MRRIRRPGRFQQRRSHLRARFAGRCLVESKCYRYSSSHRLPEVAPAALHRKSNWPGRVDPTHLLRPDPRCQTYRSKILSDLGSQPELMMLRSRTDRRQVQPINREEQPRPPCWRDGPGVSSGITDGSPARATGWATRAQTCRRWADDPRAFAPPNWTVRRSR